ncbi:MAG: hypothetical protein KDB03_22460, partial [Planctomycetales bacterium]|nr:hypothetical protein [Planctomycetales bacterium]
MAADLYSPADTFGLWTRISTQQIEQIEGIAEVHAVERETFELSRINLEKLISNLPDESSQSLEQVVINLPRPDGQLEQFYVYNSSIMAPELAAEFPEIQTFAGHGVLNSAASVRFDLTPAGFHAQVLSPTGAYYVDPYFHLNDKYYASYFATGQFDIDSTFQEEFDELTTSVKSNVTELSSPPGSALDEVSTATGSTSAKDGGTANRSGTQLRTYRTAVAATGEYTAFHGGTVALGQAAIVTAINRVTGIYESELSIRLELVANNSSLVYTNSATDPYTNNNGSTMLGQNQTNVDTVIGPANYDIGHVFSTGGGGIASLGVVGVNGVKARGVTGLNAPTGDAFWVDYVAHEMGHQFGGSHTFNSSSGSCAGNRNAATAYEPGSGSTIQAYAGICNADNLQNNSDPYFHFVSFDEIIAYVDGSIPSVGTRTATGNTVPTVEAGNNFTIPASTPFALTAVGLDSDSGDVLTFNWEERDLGASTTLAAADNGSSPLFRSWPATTDPTRTFPRLSNLVSNTVPIGEKLPTTNRTMRFRATVRDNSTLLGSGVNTDDMQVTVVNTGSPFQVTSPNSNVTWTGFSSQNVTWNVAGTTGNGINAANVDIWLSTDGGFTYSTLLASSVPNSGTFSLTVPNLPTTSARIKVQGSNNIFFDISNTNFTINAVTTGEDFGDAPNSYGTLLASNGARHTFGGPTLGLGVDVEPDGQPSPLADGDGADEDGIQFLDPLVAGGTTRMQVTSSAGGGVLNYFIDFDGNGVFGNQINEVYSASLSGGQETINLNIPAGSAGNTYARFRISSTGIASPIGLAVDGEVEDYAITIYSSAPDLDFGDAPISYSTLLADDGARHIETSLRLGDSIDHESEGQANSTSTGDGRDEDGIIFRQILVPGRTVDFSVTASGNGILDYFLDFNRNGVFDVSEHFSAAVIAGSQQLSVSVPLTASLGVTSSRFRLSSAGGLSAGGLALDGEVEDYQIELVNPPIVNSTFENFDSVTAPTLPSGWTTTSTSTNTWRTETGNSSSAPNNAFAQNLPTASDSRLLSPTFVVTDANANVHFRNWYNLESGFDGGVLEISISGGTFQDIVTAGGTFISGGYNQTIFGNPIGTRPAWSGNSNNYIDTVVALPESAKGQNTQLRWRLGTDTSVNATGWRIDTITFSGVQFSYDFGDAPDPSYPTRLSSNGAAHAESPLRLGALNDYEADGQGNASASGDGAEDDGIAGAIQLIAGAANSLSVTASAGGLLNLWLDIDGNGSWSGSDEQLFKDYPLTVGSNTLNFTLPSTTPKDTFARLRFSSQSALAPDGFAPSGEVEDYAVSILQLSASVVDTAIFYNASNYDGSAVASAADDLARAVDKSAYRAGSGVATFNNYTSYTRGINGVMVDIESLAGTVSASDFVFRVGNNNTPALWALAPAPTSISVRTGAGVNGSSRVTIIWPDGAIKNQWLQVNVLPTANTGLATIDTHYWGNQVGEVGDTPGSTAVDVSDTLLITLNQTGFQTIPTSNRYDLDRDGAVNSVDYVQSQLSQTGFITLFLLNLSSGNRDGNGADGSKTSGGESSTSSELSNLILTSMPLVVNAATPSSSGTFTQLIYNWERTTPKARSIAPLNSLSGTPFSVENATGTKSNRALPVRLNSSGSETSNK